MSEAEGTSETETYELSLKGEGITVERTVQKDVALQILAAILGTGGMPTAVAGGLARTTAVRPVAEADMVIGGGRPESLREFLDNADAKRNVEKILAIAKYLELSNPETAITPDVIKAQFRKASEKVPGNYARDFRWAVSNGWLAPIDGAPGEYYITKTGTMAVEEKFSSEIKKKTGVEKSRARRRTTRNAASDA